MSTAADQATIDDLVGNAHGNAARVREILEEHPELVNGVATWQETPIQAAAQMGNRAILEMLLGLGAPLDCYTAAALGRAGEVREFLASQPVLATGTGVHGLPALYFAAVGNSVETAELFRRHVDRLVATHDNQWLLQNGADPTLTDYEHKTPLERAVGGGHAEVAGLLRERL